MKRKQEIESLFEKMDKRLEKEKDIQSRRESLKESRVLLSCIIDLTKKKEDDKELQETMKVLNEELEKLERKYL